MSNELAIPEVTSTLANNEEQFNELATSSKFLPRLTLTAALSTVVQDNLIQAGRWAIINGKQVVDLGVEARGWVIAVRLKAMDTGADPVVSYYDPANPMFVKIKERAEVEKQGPLAGPEFLIYIPSEKCFCTLFMCSKTMRREAPIVKQLLRKAATFKITLVSNKKNRWHAPVITACAITEGMVGPEPEKLQKILHAFMNPPAVEVEEATDAEKAATGGRER